MMQRHVSLTHANTLGLPAVAEHYWALHSEADLQQLAIRIQRGDLPQPLRVLGGGSNLVMGGALPGLTLHMGLRGRHVIQADAQRVRLQVAAGEPWPEFVAWTVDQGWRGLENLALIPGTVGAAPVQNIGAYGLEIGERLVTVQGLDLHTGARFDQEAQAWGLGYRDSLFRRNPGRWLITGITLDLPQQEPLRLQYPDLQSYLGLQQTQRAGLQEGARSDSAKPLTGHSFEPTARDVFDAVCDIRRRKLPDPVQIGNAGSFFKNPVVSAEQAKRLAAAWPNLPQYSQPDGQVKLAAAWLIDQCDWKGRQLGPVGVHERQALVLVHRGGGTAQDLLGLAAHIQADVQARFDVILELEPLVWLP